MAYFLHSSSYVDNGAQVGEGTKIWHFSHVMNGAEIGFDCILGQNVFVASGVIIGNGCRIQNNVSLYEGVVLADNVFCGPSVVFTNVRHPRAQVSRKAEFDCTRIEQGATLGANCTIVCGVSIGEWAFVAAGTVVTKDVPPYALVAGASGRRIGWACVCGESLRLRSQFGTCDRCGEQYCQSDVGLERIEGPQS